MNEIGRVLCVDDDPQLLAGLARNLRRHFPVATATGGVEALDLLRKDRSYAVIISDMRMPGMDGAAFFAEAKLLVPNAVRVLLTGQADMSAVIAAINEGRIYRYLTKPIDKDTLVQVVGAAMAQYRLVVEQAAAANDAVRGALDLVTHVLALASPEAFGRAVRVRRRVAELVEAFGLSGSLMMEAAAVLTEIAKLEGSGGDVAALLGSFRELDEAAAFVAEADSGKPVRVGARVLMAARAIDALERTGVPFADCIDQLEREGRIDVRLAASARAQHPAGGEGAPSKVSTHQLPEGARVAAPIRDKSGGVLVPMGVEVTPFVKARLSQLVTQVEEFASVAASEGALLATGST